MSQAQNPCFRCETPGPPRGQALLPVFPQAKPLEQVWCCRTCAEWVQVHSQGAKEFRDRYGPLTEPRVGH